MFSSMFHLAEAGNKSLAVTGLVCRLTVLHSIVFSNLRVLQSSSVSASHCGKFEMNVAFQMSILVVAQKNRY